MTSAKALPYLVAATYFMEYLDTTVIATALPQMARSFSVGPNEVSLGMTAYMLTMAVFIPVSGWIADRVGSRTVFTCAIATFTVASVACGFSSGVFSFTAARVLQGIGGAMMVPVGRMIVVRNTEKSRMMQAISAITWPAIIAPVVGPTLGGFITTYASWHWIFFLNVPLGILALIATGAIVPNQSTQEKRRFDCLGFLLSGLALACILYGAELAGHQNVGLARAMGFEVAGFGIGALAVRSLLRTSEPLLDLSSLQVPTYAASVLWGTATRIGIEAVPYLTPLLLQLGFGLSAFHSGLLLLATAIGNIGMKFFTTRIFRRFGFRSVAVANGVAAALLTFACGRLVPFTPLAVTILVLFGYGLSRSLQFSTLATLAYADVTDAQKTAASTLLSVSQQMSIAMGIAFGAVCLRTSTLFDRSDGLVQSTHYGLTDFKLAFAMAAFVTLISVIGYVRLPRDAGHELGAGAGAAKGK